jgi:hypothetical protein
MFDSLKNLGMQIKRAWDIYIDPPAESKIFVSPDGIVEVAGEIDRIPTKGQPKQVATWNNYAIVSCMSGKAVQFFDTKDDLNFAGEVEFQDQCVELEIDRDFLYVTSTNFARTPHPKHNYFSYISPKLGTAEYGGAPRDIVIDSDDTALFSNLGDNTINRWSISKREVIKRVRVGKEPNSIRLLENNILAVSCRTSKAVYMLDIKSLEIVGRSTMTGETPTGLAPIEGGFLATDFDSNQLRRFKY